jgi:putative transcriptional regulator
VQSLARNNARLHQWARSLAVRDFPMSELRQELAMHPPGSAGVAPGDMRAGSGSDDRTAEFPAEQAQVKGELKPQARRKAAGIVNVREIRERLGLTQEEFALRFGFSLSTVQHWEQGRRHPQGSSRLLLMVIARDPVAVQCAVATGAEPALATKQSE